MLFPRSSRRSRSARGEAQAGAVGANGRISIKIPNLNLQRGTPNTVPLQGVSFDPTNNQIKLGNLVKWPKN